MYIRHDEDLIEEVHFSYILYHITMYFSKTVFVRVGSFIYADQIRMFRPEGNI